MLTSAWLEGRPECRLQRSSCPRRPHAGVQLSGTAASRIFSCAPWHAAPSLASANLARETLRHPSGQTSRATEPELEALRAGDAAAFERLVERYSDALLRLALGHVRERSVAEEVVQETWLQVIRSLDRFEGRSSLKTWIFGIGINVARHHQRRESRSLPFSSLFRREDDHGVELDESRFGRDGAWVQPPASWAAIPEEHLLGVETRERIEAALAELPPRLREIAVLRDVAGWTSEEVCNVLKITPANQRVRLHRARTAIRQRLEEYLR
jgi:RNA polymerase sigma-70 factor (ECF subfamily)